jgi:Radical SAM superfamily/Iron-sulfur cluster-binding domain
MLNEAILKWYPRGKDRGNIVNRCNLPYKALGIDTGGECFLCQCEAWLPVSVGNILDFHSLAQVWDNPVAQELQRDVDEKKFTHCAVEHCFITEQDIVFDNYQISVNIDETCNLACPSCRRELINHNSGADYEKKLNMVNHLVNLINEFDQPMKLVMSGNGDPLASLIMRPLLLNWRPKHNQTIKLFTNGLLMRKLLPNSPVYPHIDEYQISVDAGSKSVYEVVRQPGKFEVLLDNLTWLAETRKVNTKVYLQFCLSGNNATDIVNFAELCKKFGFVGNITKLDNWNTFDDFNSVDVVDNPEHLLHNIALEQLSIVDKYDNICLNSYLKKVINE